MQKHRNREEGRLGRQEGEKKMKDCRDKEREKLGGKKNPRG